MSQYIIRRSRPFLRRSNRYTTFVRLPLSIPHLVITFLSSLPVSKLASFQEYNLEYTLPFPISKLILTYATLTDPQHTLPIVQFCSLAIYDFNNHQIFHAQRLTATVPGCWWSSDTPTQIAVPNAFLHQTPLSQPYLHMAGGRGYNTFHGFDTGPPPPGLSPSQPAGQHPYPFNWPQAPMGFPAFHPPAVMAPQMLAPPLVMPGWGFYGAQTHPAMPPVPDRGFPGIQYVNQSPLKENSVSNQPIPKYPTTQKRHRTSLTLTPPHPRGGKQSTKPHRRRRVSPRVRLCVSQGAREDPRLHDQGEALAGGVSAA